MNNYLQSSVSIKSRMSPRTCVARSLQFNFINLPEFLFPAHDRHASGVSRAASEAAAAASCAAAPAPSSAREASTTCRRPTSVRPAFFRHLRLDRGWTIGGLFFRQPIIFLDILFCRILYGAPTALGSFLSVKKGEKY